MFFHLSLLGMFIPLPFFSLQRPSSYASLGALIALLIFCQKTKDLMMTSMIIIIIMTMTTMINILAVGETLTSLIRDHHPDSESDTDLDPDADPDPDSCFELANFHIHVLRCCITSQ